MSSPSHICIVNMLSQFNLQYVAQESCKCQKCHLKKVSAVGVPVCRSGPTVQIHTDALSPLLCLHTSQSDPVKAAGVPVRISQDTTGCVVNAVTWCDDKCKAAALSFEESSEQFNIKTKQNTLYCFEQHWMSVQCMCGREREGQKFILATDGTSLSLARMGLGWLSQAQNAFSVKFPAFSSPLSEL